MKAKIDSITTNNRNPKRKNRPIYELSLQQRLSPLQHEIDIQCPKTSSKPINPTQIRVNMNPAPSTENANFKRHIRNPGHPTSAATQQQERHVARETELHRYRRQFLPMSIPNAAQPACAHIHTLIHSLTPALTQTRCKSVRGNGSHALSISVSLSCFLLLLLCFFASFLLLLLSISALLLWIVWWPFSLFAMVSLALQYLRHYLLRRLSDCLPPPSFALASIFIPFPLYYNFYYSPFFASTFLYMISN